MANLLNKESVISEQERRSFIADLHRFHQIRGTLFDLIPKIAGREIDLHRLYRRVVELGGWRKVCNELKWEDLQTEFGLPAACGNGEQALKVIYVRFLYLYEKVNFLGEDPDQKESENDANPHRKKAPGPFYGVPLKYNYAQHQIPDLLRKNNGFCLELISTGDYDKLEMALMSGLPNEVDFAINVCTLLSNEGRHVLRLDKCKHLLQLLLAHIGVFNQGYESFYDLYKYGWTPYTERDFLRFWYESVKDEGIRQLITINNTVYTREAQCGHEVLHLGSDIGVHSVEGQRVTQLAVLLRNLSFEDINQKLMASNAVVFKFLMLCVHSMYGSLKQLALDTLGNLAAQMVLDSTDNHRTNLILDFITKSFCADDKFTVVRALEILGKLCQVEANECYLTETLLSKTYEDVFQLLTVHDIQLIVHTLEALYQLSELGATTTTKIAQVRNAVDILIDLITVEAQSYGPNSLVGIKVVEYVPAPNAGKDSREALGESTPVTKPISVNVGTATSTPLKLNTPTKTPVKQIVSADIEATTLNWMQATYEARRIGRTAQIDFFSEYLQFCHKFNLANAISSTEFLALVKSAFPQCETRMVATESGDKDVCFLGISKRNNPKPFSITNTVPKSMSVSVNLPSGSQASNSSPLVANTPTPTLRQRLMEPPRHAIHQPIVHSGSTSTPSTSKSQTSSTTPRPIAPKPVAKQLQLGSTFVISQAPRPPGSQELILQNTPIKGPKLAPKPASMTNQQFPSIHSALQGDGSNNFIKTATILLENDSLQKSADTNLIKSLLAKKLNQNLVGRQTITVNIPASQGSHVKPDIMVPQYVLTQHPSSELSNQLLSKTLQANQSSPASSVHESSTTTTSTTTTSSKQPLLSQVPSLSTTSKTDQTLKSSVTSQDQLSSKLPISNLSAAVPAKSEMQSESFSKVAKTNEHDQMDLGKLTDEAVMKCLQETDDVTTTNNTPSPILSTINHTTGDTLRHHLQTNTTVSLSLQTSHLVTVNNTITTNCLQTNSLSCDVQMTNNDSETELNVAKESNKCTNNIKINGNPAINGKGSNLKGGDAPPGELKCNEVNNSLSHKLINGNVVSSLTDSDLPPSPICLNNIQSGLINGISDDSMDSISSEKPNKMYSKDQIVKAVEKTGKLNGISKHIGNGDHVDMEVDHENGDNSKQPNFTKHNGNTNVINTNSSVQISKDVPKEFMNIIVNAEVCPAVIKIHSTLLDDKKICETIRHVPTPETSRDSELSSDSFASSTAESVPEKHSTPVTTTVAQPPTPKVLDKTPVIGASDKKPKSRKRRQSSSGSTPSITVAVTPECKTTLVPVQVVDFMCEWAGCNRCFENAKAVFYHVVKTHTVVGCNGFCQWSQCPQVKRQRWSLITHVQDHHCSESALRLSSVKRQQQQFQVQPSPNKKPSLSSVSPITTTATQAATQASTPTPAPASSSSAATSSSSATTTVAGTTTDSKGSLVYPNDAAMQAIKRFLVRPPFQEFFETREGPVTKHIRLTAALILRNIARYSPVGRSLIKKKESQISYVTMSAVESSTALASCLWEILDHH